jgi:hypothetical protein
VVTASLVRLKINVLITENYIEDLEGFAMRWFDSNQNQDSILICRIELNGRGGFSVEPELAFYQRCHENGKERFNTFSLIAANIVKVLDSGNKENLVEICDFEEPYIPPEDRVCGAPKRPELIHIMINKEDLDKAILGEQVKITIRTSEVTKERFLEVFRKISNM